MFWFCRRKEAMPVESTVQGVARKTIRANGIDIAYVDEGMGIPLLLLHGALVSNGPAWAGSAVAYLDHIHSLARLFRVIAPDTRGSGATAHDGGSASFDILVNDVLALVDALDLDRPIVAGFSEGGATATVFALTYPNRIRALINHGGFDYFFRRPEIEAQFRMIFGGRPDATGSDPDAAEAIFMSDQQMADIFMRMKADYDGAQGSGHWRKYLELFFERTVAGVGRDAAVLGQISVPTLVLVGDRDHFCSVEMAAETYRAVPKSELCIVPGTGHEVNTGVVDALIHFAEQFPV
jgi:pimeloyl-ACP methyl ester carboxylesterase